MSWQALGHDPVPGDVATVHRTAATMADIASDAETLDRRLRTLDDAVGPLVWRGDMAEAFRGRLGDVAPAAVRLALAHREAEHQLTAYADALGQAQEQARQAERDAAGAIADRDRHRATADAAAADTSAQAAVGRACRAGLAASSVRRIAAPPDPTYLAQLDAYDRSTRARLSSAETAAAAARHREQVSRRDLAAADQRLNAARRLADDAREQRDAAARRLVEHLDASGAPSRRIDLFGAAATVRDLTEKLVTASKLAESLSQNRHRVGRYKRVWEHLLKWVERDGGPSRLLRYKSSPTIQWLGRVAAQRTGPVSWLRTLEKTRLGKLIDVTGYVVETGRDVAELRRHLGNGDGWGVAGESLGIIGRTAQQVPHPVAYLGGFAVRQWGSVIESARQVDWSEPPTWDGLKQYGWDSFKDGVLITGRQVWGNL